MVGKTTTTVLIAVVTVGLKQMRPEVSVTAVKRSRRKKASVKGVAALALPIIASDEQPIRRTATAIAKGSLFTFDCFFITRALTATSSVICNYGGKHKHCQGKSCDKCVGLTT